MLCDSRIPIKLKEELYSTIYLFFRSATNKDILRLKDKKKEDKASSYKRDEKNKKREKKIQKFQTQNYYTEQTDTQLVASKKSGISRNTELAEA